MFGYVKRNPRV